MPVTGVQTCALPICMGFAEKGSFLATAYHNQEPCFAQFLATEVVKEGRTFDAVVSPPSSRNDIDAYRNAILTLAPARVLSGFTRKGKVKAGDSGSSLADMIDEFNYAPDGQEREILSLLIVDEIIAEGKTAAALLEHLKRHGLPNEAEVILAVWTVVKH